MSGEVVYLVMLEFEDTEGEAAAYWSYEHQCDISSRAYGVFESEERLQQAIEGLTVGKTEIDGRLILGGYVMAIPLNRLAQGGWVRSL